MGTSIASSDAVKSVADIKAVFVCPAYRKSAGRASRTAGQMRIVSSRGCRGAIDGQESSLSDAQQSNRLTERRGKDEVKRLPIVFARVMGLPS